jgi:ubiquinone/menaquinone biosynthesis C-methylase UbiE
MAQVQRSVGGLPLPTIWGSRVLEVGCGHGGITCYLASLGVRVAVGLDVNSTNLAFGRELTAEISARSGQPLPAAFLEMDAGRLAFPAGAFDLIVADNVFEHLTDPASVLTELHRVLSPGGVVVVPIFSSIRSKYGAHLKQGLRLPWVNLVFSDVTIIGALRRQASRRPELLDTYAGLNGNPRTIAELRRFRDLNDITYQTFRELSASVGFEVRTLDVRATLVGKVLRRLYPRFDESELAEVLSTGAAAVLAKDLS